jgi:hypothetical protein
MRRIHLVLAILMVSGIAATATAQGVADLARQERARKKPGDSKAVLTNNSETLPKGTEPGSLNVTPAPAAATGTAKTPEAAASDTTGLKDNKGRDEKYWRSTFEKARQDLKRAEDKLAVLELKRNDLQGALYREGIYEREQQIRQEISETEKAEAMARDDVAAAQKNISDLEDELRRSGGPPGWAR